MAAVSLIPQRQDPKHAWSIRVVLGITNLGADEVDRLVTEQAIMPAESNRYAYTCLEDVTGKI